MNHFSTWCLLKTQINHYLQHIVTVGELSCLYLLQGSIDANKRCKVAKNKCGKYACFKLEYIFPYLVVTLMGIFLFLLYK